MTGTAPGTCALCGAADPLGTTLCPACLTSSSGRRTLLFIDRARAAAAIHVLLGSATGQPEARAGLRSGRPLLAVPDAAAPRVLEGLETRGIRVRAVPAAWPWRAFPLHFTILLLCVLVAGTIAGIVAQPTLLRATPPFALLLLLLGLRALGRPVIAPDSAALPGTLRASVAATLVGLEPGPARNGLVDLLRSARPLLVATRAKTFPARTRKSVHGLIRAACVTACEIDRLSRNADAIRSSLVWTPEVAGEEHAGEARSALRRANDLAANGLARIADGGSALDRIAAATTPPDGSARAGLARLTRDLELAARDSVGTVRALNRLVA